MANDRAISDVQREVRALGLSSLYWWVTISTKTFDLWTPTEQSALGWYKPSALIEIPAFGRMANNIGAWFSGLMGNKLKVGGMRDVLRHEYGHALRDAFGEHDKTSPVWGREPLITDYARDQKSLRDKSDEDFAEFFMLFCRCGGNLSKARIGNEFKAKWKLMATTVKEVATKRVLKGCDVICGSCGEECFAEAPAVQLCPYCDALIDLT